MTFPIEIGSRLDLQLGSLDIPVDMAPAFQLKQVLDLDRPGYLAHNVGLLTVDITLYNTTCTDDHLGRAVDVPYQVPVDTQIAVAGNIALHRRSGPNKAGAGARGGIFSKDIRFGFSIEHSIRF